MDAVMKEKWIEALNSGKYEQGTGALKTKNGYCCLGVLCDLERKRLKKKKWEKVDVGACRYLDESDDEVFSYLPYSISNKYGIDPVQQDKLINLNDKKRKTFKDIASWIRKNM